MKNQRTPVHPNEETKLSPVRQAIAPPRIFISRKIEEAGGSEVLARRIRETGIVTQMNRPVLEHWTREPDSFDGIDPVTRTLRLIEATGNLLPLHWLCGRLGCHFVHGPGYYERIMGQGAVTWFEASIHLHELRRTVIRAFLRDNPGSMPEISAEEGRIIAKSWAGVFAWIEGYLNRCRGTELPISNLPPEPRPILFRNTEPWRVIAESMQGLSREAVSEAVAHPFGKLQHTEKGETRFPKKDTLDKWAQSRGEDGNEASGTRGPLDYTLALSMAAKSFEPIVWLAEQLGGYVISPANPTAQRMSQSDMLRYWERTMVELSELDAMIARAHLDGEVCPKEREMLEREWLDVAEWMNAFVSVW